MGWKLCRLACPTVWTFSSQCFVCTARDALTGAWYDRECTRGEEYDSYLLMPILRRIDACLPMCTSRCLSFRFTRVDEYAGTKRQSAECKCHDRGRPQNIVRPHRLSCICRNDNDAIGRRRAATASHTSGRGLRFGMDPRQMFGWSETRIVCVFFFCSQ